MADILTIRRLAEPVHAALRERARKAGRSMEAEAREILTTACLGSGRDAWLTGLRERARRRTRDRCQTDSAELIREGRDAR
jgi:plasmid stability protein